jgi:DeoR family galactitol utilization operon repressor
MISGLSEREKQILELLAEDSGLSSARISEQLNVSAVTIRSDLKSLEEKGFIVRMRGASALTFHKGILARHKNMLEAKNRIAKEAASLVQDGDNIMILAGTTTALVAKYLLGKRDIHVVTNSTLVIPYARVNPALDVTVLGGRFSASSESLMGPITMRELEQFHVKYAFVGTDSFSLENGLTAHQVEGAEIAGKMPSRASTTVLMVDSSKYGKSGFAHILPLSSMDMIITDDGLDVEVRNSLRENGINLKTV